MPILEWKDAYSIGNAKIDSEHMKLVEMINTAHASVDSKTSNRDVEKLVDAMVEYAKTHFATEEKYMAEYNYPDTANHKNEHWQFVTNISKEVPFADGPILPGTVKILSFLADWLVKHMMGTDRKLGEFLQEKGVR